MPPSTQVGGRAGWGCAAGCVAHKWCCTALAGAARPPRVQHLPAAALRPPHRASRHAPPAAGNSGGPLLDSGGAMIGINTAIYSQSGNSAGVGFAIPVDVVKSSVEQVGGRAQQPPSPSHPEGSSAALLVEVLCLRRATCVRAGGRCRRQRRAAAQTSSTPLLLRPCPPTTDHYVRQGGAPNYGHQLCPRPVQ